MRAVVWCAHFAPHMGGVERFTQSLWSIMARRGCDVTVITTNEGRAAPREEVDGLRVVRLPARQVLEGRVPLPKRSNLLRDTLRELRDDPPDMFVSNTRFFPTSVLAARIARQTGRPLLHIEHGSAHIELGRPLIDHVTRAYDAIVGRWVLRRATLRTGVSAAACDFVRRFGATDAVILYNGVDTAGWDKPAADMRWGLGLREDAVVVASAGRLIEAKGVLDLLAAWDGIDDHPEAHLVFAGTGPLEQSLRDRAAGDPRIHMLGRLRPDGVRDLLLAADIFVHPSAFPEGLPTVILEAAAARLPVIATPMGGSAEAIEDDVSGIIVPPGDAVALRRALVTLIDDPSLRAQYGSRARDTVERCFDWNVIADRLEACVAELPPGRGRREGR